MKEFDDLKRRIWVTKNARYNAAKRLKKTSLWSLWTITILSLVLIFISIFSIVFSDTMNPFQIKIIGVSSVMISIYMICVSLFMAIADFTKRQAVLFLSANALLELYNRMNANLQINAEQLLEYTHEYQAVLDHYNENHDQTDYLLALALGDDNAGFGRKILAIAQHNARHVILSILLLVIPALAVTATIYAFFGWGLFGRFVHHAP